MLKYNPFRKGSLPINFLYFTTSTLPVQTWPNKTNFWIFLMKPEEDFKRLLSPKFGPIQPENLPLKFWVLFRIYIFYLLLLSNLKIWHKYFENILKKLSSCWQKNQFQAAISNFPDETVSRFSNLFSTYHYYQIKNSP